ncbi:MAG: peroxiredoxin [Epsilonproteobacteria bacterium]|nr:peroxiredoxin [Campylobacterota bacterium]
MLEVGDTVPDFCSINQDEEEICFRDIRGRWIVLYFYPKDNTKGCTLEAIDFTDSLDEFNSLDTTILGVSPDSPKRHRNFIEKQGLKITLLADEDKNLANLFGVWRLKRSYGREYMGIVRSTFIISPDGKIAHRWSSVRVKGHVEKVKERLSELISKQRGS